MFFLNVFFFKKAEPSIFNHLDFGWIQKHWLSSETFVEFWDFGWVQRQKIFHENSFFIFAFCFYFLKFLKNFFIQNFFSKIFFQIFSFLSQNQRFLTILTLVEYSDIGWVQSQWLSSDSETLVEFRDFD